MERTRRGRIGKEDVHGMVKSEEYALVMVQNRLELLGAYDGAGAHLRLEDKHRHLYKLVDTPGVRSTGYKHNPH